MLKPRNTNLVLFKRIPVPPRTRDVFVPSVRSRAVVFFAAFLLLALPLFSFTRVNTAHTNTPVGLSARTQPGVASRAGVSTRVKRPAFAAK